jgi:flavin-binding protein dodecin
MERKEGTLVFTVCRGVLPFRKVQQTNERRTTMHYGEDRVYKKIEVIGVSKKGIEEAIQAAISKAHKTLEKVSWFEVEEIHGHVDDEGTVTEYQVILKVSFQLK